MARVREVILRTAPPSPHTYSNIGEALALNPSKVVVDSVYLKESHAQDAAFRVNADKRPDLPADTYFGIWSFDPDATDPVPARADDGEKYTVGSEQRGRFELLVGLKTAEPDAWRETIAMHASRKVSPYARQAEVLAGEPGEIRIKDVPEGPESYTSMEAALAMNPTALVVDGVYPKDFPVETVEEDGEQVTRRRPFTPEEVAENRGKAENAAYLLNCGDRKKWPADTYWGSWGPEVDEEGNPTGRFELRVGLKEHMPEGWRKTVETAGSRRRRRASKVQTD